MSIFCPDIGCRDDSMRDVERLSFLRFFYDATTTQSGALHAEIVEVEPPAGGSTSTDSVG